jgi:hypothetical protein
MDERQAKLEALYKELDAIHDANNVYWEQKYHSHDDAAEYQRRIERLAAIRDEIEQLQI